MALTAKNKKMIYWGVAIAALAGLAWYAHEKNWLGTKDTDTTSKAVSNASGRVIGAQDAKGCTDANQGWRCVGGTWQKNDKGTCYCTGDVLPLKNIESPKGTN